MMLVEKARWRSTRRCTGHPEWRDLGVYAGGFMETFRTTRTKRPDDDDRPAAPHLRPHLRLPQQRTNVDAAIAS